MKIIIKPKSRRDNNKWIPEGMVSFLNGPDLMERREWCEEIKFDTKEEADKYFTRVCDKKYRIKS